MYNLLTLLNGGNLWVNTKGKRKEIKKLIKTLKRIARMMGTNSFRGECKRHQEFPMLRKVKLVRINIKKRNVTLIDKLRGQFFRGQFFGAVFTKELLGGKSKSFFYLPSR